MSAAVYALLAGLCAYELVRLFMRPSELDELLAERDRVFAELKAATEERNRLQEQVWHAQLQVIRRMRGR